MIGYHVSSTELPIGTILTKGKFGKDFYSALISNPVVPKTFLIEAIFEDVRKELTIADNINRVNRSECIFVSKDMNAARSFALEFRNPIAHIYRVDVSEDAKIFQGDFNLVTRRMNTIEQIRKNATRYWNGENFTGVMEVLVDGQVKILEKIETIN